MPFSTQELAQFAEDGFIVQRQLIPQERSAEILQEIDSLHERMHRAKPDNVGITWEGFDDDRPPRIRQLMHSDRISPGIDWMIHSDAILDRIEQLVGPDIVLFHSKLMMKSAKDGTFTPWHQDWSYWKQGNIEPSHINCMVALDAQDQENGCIRFVRGSHKQGYVEHTVDKSAPGFQIGLPGDLDAYDSVPVPMAPGDAVFFGPLIIHASAPNHSPRHRRANTMAFDRVGNRSKAPAGFVEKLLRGALPVSG